MDLERTIDATAEPITLAMAKKQCRVDVDDDDQLLSLYITAARQYCEKVTNRAFLQQTWRMTLRDFPNYGWYRRPGQAADSLPYWRTPAILLPMPRLIGIASITYLDSAGTRQTLDPSFYTMNGDALPARVTPAIGKIWPYGTEVQITYTAGYGATASSVPASLQLAILMLVGHFYENREASVLPASGTGVVEIPLGVEELLKEETFTCFSYEDLCVPGR